MVNEVTGAIEKADPASSHDCSYYYTTHPKCPVVYPGTGMFRFFTNEHTLLTQPPELIIQVIHLQSNPKDSLFQNFLDDMNSLVDLSSSTAFVRISDTIFKRFGICGSVIANQRHPPHSKFPFEEFNRPSTKISDYIIRNSVAEFSLTHQYYDVYMPEAHPLPFTCPDDSSVSPGFKKCFSLTIRGCTFQNMQYLREPTATIPKAVRDPDNRFYNKFRGAVVNLNGFEGPVVLKGNKFQY